MNLNGITQKHWLKVTGLGIVDALLLMLALVLATELRFLESDMIGRKLMDYWPSMIGGAVSLPCVLYILGFYSPHLTNDNALKRAFVLGICFAAVIGCMIGLFYINYSGHIGRGVMSFGMVLAYLLVFLHHTIVQHRQQNYRERVALIVSCPFDEVESEIFESFWAQHLELVGIIHYDDYKPTHTKSRVLGKTSDMADIVQRAGIDRIVCTDKSISDPAMCRQFCQLRYSGVTVMPLIGLCEEVFQSVPLELVTTEWLMHASGSPHMLYLRKAKRAFDVVVSLLGLLFLGPAMLIGMLLTKITAPGPMFYYQVRCGRFGKTFKVIKIRTMRVDAEKNGAVWCATNDNRVTPVGGFLRKYRIDEIPQIINVLRGEMSFVGPRPERPEFVDMLAKQIPFYHERHMVQPGITGWAQVNYPYGSSVDDTRRKLEYDLYYSKHMSLFLDVFVLLDTVRIVLTGGLNKKSKRALPSYNEAFARHSDFKGNLKEANQLG